MSAPAETRTYAYPKTQNVQFQNIFFLVCAELFWGVIPYITGRNMLFDEIFDNDSTRKCSQ